MTLDSTTSKVQYTQAGTTTAWPVTFKFLDNEDLIVVTTVDDVDTTLVLDTDYTVTGAGDDDGGTVTISPAVAAGTRVTIYRQVDLDQPTALTVAGGWYPTVHEAVFDRLTMIDQQQQEQIDRSLKLVATSTLDPEAVVEDIFEARDDAQAAMAAAEASAERAEIASSTVAYYNHEGTLSTGEDTITLPWAYDTEVGVEVYLSGVKQTESVLTFTDSYTVTLDTPVDADTPFEVVASAGAKGDLADLLAINSGDAPGSSLVGYDGATVEDALDARPTSAALAASDGSALVGFLQDGTGATARTVQAKLRDFVSVKDFGAVGDGVTDDGEAIANAISSGAGKIFFPAGSYLVTSPIEIAPGTNGLVLFGAGKGVSRIVNTGTDAIQLVGTGSTDETGVFGVKIADMTVEGDGSTGHGIYLSLAYHCVIDNVEATGHGADGIRVRMGFYNEIRQCRCHGNGGNGLFIGKTGNANSVIGGHYRINAGAGIRVDAESTTDYPHGISLFAPTIEANGTYGVHLNAANEVRIIASYLESTSAFGTTAQIYIAGASKWCSVEDCNFAGDVLSVDVSSGQDCELSGNSINYGLTIGSSSVRTTVENNRRIEGTITDNSGTTVFLDRPGTTNRWYIKQGTDKGYSLLVGGAATVENYGANYHRMDFNTLTSAFTHKVLDLGGTNTPILMIGAYRLWVTGGKLYINGSDPTTTTDGTVVGTQS